MFYNRFQENLTDNDDDYDHLVWQRFSEVNDVLDDLWFEKFGWDDSDMMIDTDYLVEMIQ